MQEIHQEKRQSVRFRSQAYVTIPGFFNDNALLKDISVTGCCIEVKTPVNIKVGNQYTVSVTTETETDIGKFDLLAEARWSQLKGDGGEIGFMIISSPTGKQFERYVDYLTWRSS